MRTIATCWTQAAGWPEVVLVICVRFDWLTYVVASHRYVVAELSQTPCSIPSARPRSVGTLPSYVRHKTLRRGSPLLTGFQPRRPGREFGLRLVSNSPRLCKFADRGVSS